MLAEKSTRSLPLRDLITHAEKANRDLLEQLRTTFHNQLAEFRDLSRPVRRHSQYPSLLNVKNSLTSLQEVHADTKKLTENLLAQLQEIRERARRERFTRS